MKGLPSDPETLDILGVRVRAIDLDGTVLQVGRWIQGEATSTVSLATAHGVMDARSDPAARAAFASADLVVPDGMSMVWLLRAAGRGGAGRVYGPDLMRAICARSVEPGWRHFLLGGAEVTGARLEAWLRREYPGIRIAGRYAPPFRKLSAEEDADVVRRINASKADLVWVGLGSPKQDIWMSKSGRSIDRAVLIGVGAAFDFLSGNQRQAPRWIQRSGFEWLFRLACEPRRLWPRYSRYPLFALLVLVRLPRWLGSRGR